MDAQGGLIVITGCSGRIGTLLSHRFLDAGFRVIGIDVIPPKFQHERQDFLKLDLSSDASVKEGFEQIKHKHGGQIASCIHLAAYYSFSGEHPELYDKITVEGTGRILKALKEFTCEQFIFSSTQLLYAPCAVGQRINEESPIEAKWDYPKSKVKTEKLIHEMHGSIPAVILQIAGCYDDECHSIPISNQIERIYEKQFEAHVYPGDLTHGAPFIHLADLIDVIFLAVERRRELKDELTLLIGEETTLSYGELQNEISHLLFGTDCATYEIPKGLAKMGAWAEEFIPSRKKGFIKPWMIDLADDHWELDCSKAKRVLGWTPKHSVRETLPKMISFLKSNPAEFYHTNGLELPKRLAETAGAR